jgi:hypothetical protein
MLIERVICPYGCPNSVMLESTRTVLTGNANLLLDSTVTSPATKIVKSYSCSCCGRGFEANQQSSDRIVI